MTKKLSLIFALCIILTANLSGCGGQNNVGDNETIYDDTKVTAPADSEDTTEPLEDTTVPLEDTTEPVDDTDDIDDTDDTTEPSEDTTVNGEDIEITEPDVTPEDTEPVAEPVEPGEIISIGDALSAGETVRGKLVSGESEKMRLTVNYICMMSPDGSVFVDAEVGLECYDINCGPRANGGKITLNGETYTFSTDRIVHEERTMVYIPFDSFSCEISADENACDIEASWFFNGVYAGDEIDTLAVSATLEWAQSE